MRLTREQIEKHISVAELEQLANPRKDPPYYSRQYAEDFCLWLEHWINVGKLAPAYLRNENITVETMRQRLGNGKRYALEHDMITDPRARQVAEGLLINKRGDGIVVSFNEGSLLLASTSWSTNDAVGEEAAKPASPFITFLERISAGEEVIDMRGFVLTDDELDKFDKLASVTENYQIIIQRDRIKAVKTV